MMIQENTVVYKAEGDISLKLHLFLPQQADKQRAALLFFHGGRFMQGHPAQFFPHCRYFASRGIVAASAAYRLLGKTAASVLDCLADSRAAIRWLRSQSAKLAIDPGQVIVAGGSAGANLAANAAMRIGDEGTEAKRTVSSIPDALILFSPAVVRPVDDQDLIDERLYADLYPRPHLPPMLLLHGAADEIFSLTAVQQFSEQVTAAGNLCTLRLYPNGRHGFFNYGREENRPFYKTVVETERFLGQLGMLRGNSALTIEMMASLRHETDWQA